MPNRIRVVVADESRAVRLLLVSLLRGDDRFEVVAEVASGAAVKAHADRADLVVLDLVLEDGDGFSVIEELRGLAPRVASVIIADVDPPYLRAAATARGADGFFTHAMDADVLVDGFADAVERARGR